MSLNKTSRFLSMILRHKPGVIGITVDEHGRTCKVFGKSVTGASKKYFN